MNRDAVARVPFAKSIVPSAVHRSVSKPVTSPTERFIDDTAVSQCIPVEDVSLVRYAAWIWETISDQVPGGAHTTQNPHWLKDMKPGAAPCPKIRNDRTLLSQYYIQTCTPTSRSPLGVQYNSRTQLLRRKRTTPGTNASRCPPRTSRCTSPRSRPQARRQTSCAQHQSAE